MGENRDLAVGTDRLRRRRVGPGSTAWVCALAVVLVGLLGARAHADVGVILNESLDTSVARITGSGHTAVYLSNVCPASPIKLRLCHPGESGAVISNYINLGEDQPFEWNVVSFNIYLYGVENSEDRPVIGSAKIKEVLEERYRENYLTTYCSTESCRTSNKAEWREMVGASLSRSMYIFVVRTTVDEDRRLIEEFNALPNRNHFNGMTRNCADFTKRVVNSYFPHATRADYINDFGMTSPKAIARSFTRYALRHPDSEFRVLHIAQVPGTIKRSTECRTGTEQLYRSKKLLLPMLIFAYHELPVVTASYLLTGRFNPQRTADRYPTIEATENEHRLREAKAAQNGARVEQLEEEQSRERAEMVGTSVEWEGYRREFAGIADQAEGDGILPGRHWVEIFKRLDTGETVSADPNGALWAELPGPEGAARVGLSASDILAPDSDPRMAYQLMLARNDRILKSPKHSRETMAEFKQDWARLQSARAQQRVDPLAAGGGPETAGSLKRSTIGLRH
jgi:hypothetical protein